MSESPSLVRSLWFWLIIVGTLLSIVAAVVNLMGYSEVLAYFMGAAGALLILGGAITAILRKPEPPPPSSENIPDSELLKLASNLLGFSEADMEREVNRAALELKQKSG